MYLQIVIDQDLKDHKTQLTASTLLQYLQKNKTNMSRVIQHTMIIQVKGPHQYALTVFTHLFFLSILAPFQHQVQILTCEMCKNQPPCPVDGQRAALLEELINLPVVFEMCGTHLRSLPFFQDFSTLSRNSSQYSLC